MIRTVDDRTTREVQGVDKRFNPLTGKSTDVSWNRQTARRQSIHPNPRSARMATMTTRQQRRSSYGNVQLEDRDG